MFYMGGVTLGYFSPRAADTDTAPEQPALPAVKAVDRPKNRLSAVIKDMFAREIARRQPHVWPIHVFY